MARYKRRPKVKRYHRSFYSRTARIKRGVGIVVLVLAVLGAAWLAAPHVLDWATHTWYTVVKNRDLEAESASSGGLLCCGRGSFLAGGLGARRAGAGRQSHHWRQLGRGGCDHPDR